MSDKIDWNKVEAMADAMTDADIGLPRGQKMYTPEEGRKAYLEFRKNARKHPGYKEALRRVQAQQKAACALRLMREHANISQAEVARFELENMRKRNPDKKITDIPMRTYGMMDGKGALALAEKFMAE